MSKMVCPVKKTEVNLPEDCGTCKYLFRSPYSEGGICGYPDTDMPPLCVYGANKGINILKKVLVNIWRWKSRGR